MKNKGIIVGVFVCIVGLGLQPYLQAESTDNEPAEQTDHPIAIRIVEASGCEKNGIKLRVEMANIQDTSYRFSICTGRILCCVKGMFIVLTYADTGIGLLDAERATGQQETGEVILVGGAVYSFPITIPLERLPDDYSVPGLSLDVELGFLADGGPIHSEKATVMLAASTP